MSAFQVNLRIDNAYNKKSLFSDISSIVFVLMNAYILRFFFLYFVFQSRIQFVGPLFARTIKTA
ncbi:hypothetical protein BSBH6_02445 [Bacillus subtilis]|nr:hypothetical protein BSBH6_02445 [Bacillus subtilis]RPK24834.1 hypothetical protein BH5_01664 [Bacillus subtilis]